MSSHAPAGACASWAGDYFEHRKRRSAEETFVGIDLDVLGMIDGQKARLIEVVELFHGLEHLETDHAVLGLDLIAGNFEIFVGVGNIALVGAGPVADDSGADHVGEEFVFFAVPDEDDRAGAAAAVDFGDLLALQSPDLHFVLQDAGGPEQANHFGFALEAEAGDDFRGALTQVAGSAGDFPFLLQSAGG